MTPMLALREQIALRSEATLKSELTTVPIAGLVSRILDLFNDPNRRGWAPFLGRVPFLRRRGRDVKLAGIALPSSNCAHDFEIRLEPSKGGKFRTGALDRRVSSTKVAPHDGKAAHEHWRSKRGCVGVGVLHQFRRDHFPACFFRGGSTLPPTARSRSVL